MVFFINDKIYGALEAQFWKWLQLSLLGVSNLCQYI